jgi:hypothetical protein
MEHTTIASSIASQSSDITLPSLFKKLHAPFSQQVHETLRRRQLGGGEGWLLFQESGYVQENRVVFGHRTPYI